MADILIRGMAMPKSCDECRLFNECWCMALGVENWRKSYNKPPEGERLDDCPLVEIPTPHGRLICEDDLLVLFNDEEHYGYLDVLDVRNAPTIIPAEGGNADGN